jgi:DNA polymerase III gamma/tau subunit
MHHANVLVGSREWACTHATLDISGENPDVSYALYERMSIADVRALIHDAMLRPVRAPYRTFIIATNSILPEAQNALLKLFEEPNAHTVFYLIIPREDMLLPTLRSRLHVLAHEESVATQDVFIKFQKMNYAERLACIAERLKVEDISWAQAIVTGFEAYAHASKESVVLRDAVLLSTYFPTVGSSKKMLLEHIALTL